MSDDQRTLEERIAREPIIEVIAETMGSWKIDGMPTSPGGLRLLAGEVLANIETLIDIIPEDASDG